MHNLYTNGIHVHCDVWGMGHPLLLLPGAGFGAWFWNKMWADMTDHYHVVAPDPRGSGETDKPKGPYSVEMLARDAAGVLDDLRLRGAFVVGYQLGAYVAQQLAVQRPELVSKLVLAAADFGIPDALPLPGEVRDVLADREGEPAEVARRQFEVMTAPGFAEAQPDLLAELVEYRLSDAVPIAAMQAQGAALAGTRSGEVDLEEQLATIAAPTLVLFGEHDRIVPAGNAQRVADRISGAQAQLVPDAGHLFPLEAPSATAQALLDFLNVRMYGH